MTFGHPWMLLALLIIPAVAWWRSRQKVQPAFVYSSVQLVKGLTSLHHTSRGKILMRMRYLALALMIFALARPQLPEGDSKIRASGIDIVVALDLSGSMAAEDFTLRGEDVSRLVIAKNVLEEFVDKRPNDRIGLVAFAGQAYIAAPLTLDHNFLLQNLKRLDLHTIGDGTAIGSGLSAALNRLREVKSKSKIVILMTDGVNNAGKVMPLTAAEAAQTLGIKVYTIGVGTRGVAKVPGGRDPFTGAIRYVQQKVDIDEETLTEMARRTGGKYYRADNTEALRKIYEEIDKFERTEAEVKKYQRYREQFRWYVLAGLTLLMLEIILANTVWRRLP
jgi:Ca-activated chloride channel family protein